MTREEARKKATELVSKMTTEEKAGQLRYDAPAIERLDIPAYNWWNECLHGVARAGTATVFPQAIGLAAMFDDELLGEIADAISTEARAKYNAYSDEEDRDIYKGLTMWSPNVNIFRDPRWGRGHETYGEDPYLSLNILHQNCALMPQVLNVLQNAWHMQLPSYVYHRPEVLLRTLFRVFQKDMDPLHKSHVLFPISDL